jgi:hypothetical protein
VGLLRGGPNWHRRPAEPVRVVYPRREPDPGPDWPIEWRVEYCLKWMRHWMRRAEAAEVKYDRRQVEEVAAGIARGLDQSQAEVAWYNSLEAASLQSVGVWHHRKAVSYAEVLRSEIAAAQFLDSQKDKTPADDVHLAT